MTMSGQRRDSVLIDAIEAIRPVTFAGSVWRIVRKGRDPIQCSASGGRWDDGTFDVLYTAQARDGAIAEMYFHLFRGQPVFPALVRYELFEFKTSLEVGLQLLDLDSLKPLGIDVGKFGRLSYSDRIGEYPRTQEIGEIAHFLDFDGIIVPSARYNCLNIVTFCDRVPPDATQIVERHGIVDWSDVTI